MTTSKSTVAFAVLAALSIAGKVWLAGLGHNFDVESWALFSELVLDGKNVYAETYRNPYGPVWSYVCAGVEFVRVRLGGGESGEGFHQTLAFLLSLVDVALAFLLFRSESKAAGIVFLLNPVSWLITGFHTQFDNLAVLLGFSACLLLDRENDAPSARFALATALLGISLAVKHVLIFFPFWLLAEPGAGRKRRVACLIPLVIFGASFLPFIADERGLEGVIEHVFLYDSFHLDAFFPHLIGSFFPLKAIEELFSRVPIFSGFGLISAAAILSTGFVVRRRSHRERLFVYLAAMVVFSSASADQYLAIPLLTCAAFFRRFTSWWYSILSTMVLAGSQANVGMLPAMASYSARVAGLGLERWHPNAALFVFLVLYLGAALGGGQARKSRSASS